MGSGIGQSMRQAIKRAVITGGLEAAWVMGRAGLMRGARGRGVIFTLHHVRPNVPETFDPNGHLEITPDFLDAAIRQLTADGYRFVPLGDIPAALGDADGRPFAAFTLDDGYRNNAEHALPVFERHGVPFTIFVAGGYIDRTHSMWWETAAVLLRGINRLAFDFGHGPEEIDTASIAAKHAAFARIADHILRPGEADRVAALDAAARAHGIDPLALAGGLTMDDGELRRLGPHPLATLGAHTISHRALALMEAEAARDEMAASAARVEAITGRRPVSIAYPYGDGAAAGEREFRIAADLGFRIGVTTRPGTLDASASARLTALPRVSLNGVYQNRRYVSALGSGIPFRLMRR